MIIDRGSEQSKRLSKVRLLGEWWGSLRYKNVVCSSAFRVLRTLSLTFSLEASFFLAVLLTNCVAYDRIMQSDPYCLSGGVVHRLVNDQVFRSQTNNLSGDGMSVRALGTTTKGNFWETRWRLIWIQYDEWWNEQYNKMKGMNGTSELECTTTWKGVRYQNWNEWWTIEWYVPASSFDCLLVLTFRWIQHSLPCPLIISCLIRRCLKTEYAPLSLPRMKVRRGFVLWLSSCQCAALVLSVGVWCRRVPQIV